ncbi:hypothetical protein FC831_10440 [Clostridium botulinum]|nr:hypothetical protein [Clostridium botulinum]
MYKWKIILNNGKEYIIINDIENLSELIYNLFKNTNSDVNISTWDLAEEDCNNCKSVAIFSTEIASIEYNLK